MTNKIIIIADYEGAEKEFSDFIATLKTSTIVNMATGKDAEVLINRIKQITDMC